MPEKKRTPHQSREEMRGVSQSKWHLHDKSAEELLTELEAKLDSMTDQTYDEELVDAYLEALDEKAPLPKQFDVESSWNQFRSKHSILFDADDILPNPKHSRSFSHKFRFRKASPTCRRKPPLSGFSVCSVPRPQVSTCLVHSSLDRGNLSLCCSKSFCGSHLPHSLKWRWILRAGTILHASGCL